MSLKIDLKKGFDIKLKGSATEELSDFKLPSSYAVKPTDFIGLSRPKLLVKIGDEVKSGTPILYDKLSEGVMYSSPVSGEIIEIVRGEKRRLEEIRILPDKINKFLKFKKYSEGDIDNLSRDEIKKHVCGSGVWPNIIQRPFGLVADPDKTPKSIFISFFDSHPLSPRPSFIYENEKKFIQVGLNIIRKLTDGKVHLNHNADSIKHFSYDGCDNNLFSGPHPAGNVGIQIHNIDPINKGDIVWTTTPQGLIEIGRLFLDGKYDTSRKVCVVGSEVEKPRFIESNFGINISSVVTNNEKSKKRIISGNVLTGNSVGHDGYLGYYDNMICVLPEGDKHSFLGWIMPVPNKLSFQRAFGLLSFLKPKKNEYILDTNTNGELRAFVQTGVFEKVLPMDILPSFLFKAILANDYDEMEELGIYELLEEDIALCEFVDVSKNELQKLLRRGLNLLMED